MPGISINIDVTDFYHSRRADEMNEAGVDAVVDSYARFPIDDLIFNVNAQRTNYRSEVWPALWDGYDPEADDDQFALSHVPPGVYRESRRHILDNALALRKTGIDPNARWLARCRECGINGWLSLRMHDLHHAHNHRCETHHELYRRDDLRRVLYRNLHRGVEHGLDFAKQEVLDFHVALIDEVIERYDFAGLELDWTRHFAFFRPGHEMQDAPIISQLVADIRQKLDRKVGDSRTRIKLGCRLGESIRTCQWTGLDVMAWVENGWVDYVVPSGGFCSTDLNMPLDEWRARIPCGEVALGAAIDRGVQPHPLAKPDRTDSTAGVYLSNAETVRGHAATFIAQGIDKFYIFDHFDRDNHVQGKTIYNECPSIVDELRDLEVLKERPRRHITGYRNLVAPGESHCATLPFVVDARYRGEQKMGEIRIHVGRTSSTLNAYIALRFVNNDCCPPDTTIFVNGKRCQWTDDVKLSAPVPGHVQVFAVPRTAMLDGYNLIEVCCDDTQTVDWAEILFR